MFSIITGGNYSLEGRKRSEFSHKHHSSISILVETVAFSNSNPPGNYSVAPL